jgi:Rhs element Vgr protein
MPSSPNDSLQKNVSYTLLINGSEITQELLYNVLTISVWNEVNKICKAKVTLMAGNTEESTFEESELADFLPGNAVEISLGYDQVNTVVFKGVISKQKIDIKEGFLNHNSRSLLVLECADKATKMTFQRNSEIFENKKDSQIITELITKYDGLTKTVTASTVQHKFMSQYDITDWDFMIKRAKANGLIVLNSKNKLVVKPPAVTGTAALQLKYGDNVMSFRGEIDATTQLQATKAESWNYFTEANVTQNSSEPANLTEPGNITGSTLGEVFSPARLAFGIKTPFDTAEAKELADSLLLESRFKRVRGEVSFRGYPGFNLGSILTLDGFGTTFNGNVFASVVEHHVRDGIYITTVGFGLPENFFEKDLKDENNSWIGPIKGLHIGIVLKIDADPETQYRIKIKIPNIDATGKGLWAPLSQFYATAGAGAFFVPEVGAEVIVGFMNEDPRYPIVLGSLYNSNNAPKETFAANNKIKSILSKEKLTIEFDDVDKILTFSTPGNNKIILSDKAKGITIEDQNGNKIVTSSSGIEIKSPKDITIKATGKVAIDATGVAEIGSKQDVTVKGLNVNVKAKVGAVVKGSATAEISASGQTVVKGAIVMIN